MVPVSLLLVDDNAAFLRILRQYLCECYRDEVVVLASATGGDEALALAQQLRPEVALVDLAMPGLSGLEVIRRLRKALPEVGIIALTVLDANGYREAATGAGADEFVSKHDLSTYLLPAIRRVAHAETLGQEC